MSERVLVNFFYAPPVGHVIEAIQYAVGHLAADPGREVWLALNAASPVEIVDWCPGLAGAYPIDHPFLEPGGNSAASLAGVPEDWDVVLDDPRRHQPFQLEMFPGMRDYYATSDAHFRGHRMRSVAGFPRGGYVPRQPVRLTLPEGARVGATARLAEVPSGRRLAFLPAGSSPASHYPSAASRRLVLDALADALPGLAVTVVGRRPGGPRTHTSIGSADLDDVLAHPAVAVDAVDRPLADQLALVEACDTFLAPHTGFGMAALAVGTPWLSLSGGRWFEFWFNEGAPFRSVLPDTHRFPAFSQFEQGDVIDDDGEPRIPSMSRARVVDDLPRLVAAATELMRGAVSYEQALADYFPALVAAHHGDASPIWSIDGVHEPYVTI